MMDVTPSTASEAVEGRPGASRLWSGATSRSIKMDMPGDGAEGETPESPLDSTKTQRQPNTKKARKGLLWKHPAIKSAPPVDPSSKGSPPDTALRASTSIVKYTGRISKTSIDTEAHLTGVLDTAGDPVSDDERSSPQKPLEALKPPAKKAARGQTKKPASTSTGKRNQGGRAKSRLNKSGAARTGASVSPPLGDSSSKTKRQGKSKPAQKRRAKPSLLDSPDFQPDFQDTANSQAPASPKPSRRQASKPRPKRSQMKEDLPPKAPTSSTTPHPADESKEEAEPVEIPSENTALNPTQEYIEISSDQEESDEDDEVFRALKVTTQEINSPTELNERSQTRPPGPQQTDLRDQEDDRYVQDSGEDFDSTSGGSERSQKPQTPTLSDSDQVVSSERDNEATVTSHLPGAKEKKLSKHAGHTPAHRLRHKFPQWPGSNQEMVYHDGPLEEEPGEETGVPQLPDKQSRKHPIGADLPLESQPRTKKKRLVAMDVKTPGIGAPLPSAPGSPVPYRFRDNEDSSSDPFKIRPEDSVAAQTTFTKRLLGNAPQQPPQCQEPLPKRRMLSKAKYTDNSTDALTRRMLEAFIPRQVPQQVPQPRIVRRTMNESGANMPTRAPQGPVIQNEKLGFTAWKEATEPYDSIGQTMSLITNKLLRHLKSKDAAIDDVADEYRQRGHQMLDRIEQKHAKEQRSTTRDFEKHRGKFVTACQEARRDVRGLADRLASVDLKAIMDGLNGDQTLTCLKALRREDSQ